MASAERAILAAPSPPGRHYGVAEYPAAGLRSSALDLSKYLLALTAPPLHMISALVRIRLLHARTKGEAAALRTAQHLAL